MSHIRKSFCLAGMLRCFQFCLNKNVFGMSELILTDTNTFCYSYRTNAKTAKNHQAQT